MILLRRESRDAYKQDVLLRKSLFGAPCLARSLRRCVEIGRDTVPDHARIPDSIQPLQTNGDLPRDSHRDNASPVSKPLQPASARFDFAFRDVVHRMHHQARLDIHQRWKRVTPHVDVSVDDIRPKLLENTVQTIVGTPLEAGALAEKPRFYAGHIELLLQI